MSAPVRRQKFDATGFVAWLAENGAEVGIPTNQYEVVRYKAFWAGKAKAQTHIVYAKESGLLTYTGGSREHYECFANGDPLPDVEASFDEKRARRLKNTASVRAKLAVRDGDCCWYCGDPLALRPSNVEHLINIADGGTNALANLVLTHVDCNTRAGSLPLPAKLELRARLRSDALLATRQEKAQ